MIFDEKKIVYESSKSTGYKIELCGNTYFEKQYKWENEYKSKYEFEIANFLFKSGLRTPEPQKYSSDSLMFKYEVFKSISIKEVIEYIDAVNQFLSVLKIIEPPTFINDWNQFAALEYEPEFRRAIDSLDKIHLEKYKDILEKAFDYFMCLKGEIVTHNDFGFYNIGVIDKNIICYDLEHTSLGPIGWDFSYYISYIDPFKHRDAIKDIKVDEKIQNMIISCLCIKLGRCIKKNNCSSDFEKRLVNWIEFFNFER